jgi:hypothetical protein
MKTIPFNIVAIVALILMPAHAAIAQGSVTYLSSLNLPSGGFLSVASDRWVAQGFNTGTNSPGYQLDSIELLMGGAAGNPGDFAVSVYSRSEFFPNDRIAGLDGPTDPTTAGVFEYSGSMVTLSSATYYYIVVTAAEPMAIASYQWQHVAPATSYELEVKDGWGLSPSASSSDGLTWNRVGNVNFFQFAIYATPIPEPSALALCGLGGLFVVSMSLKRRTP